MTPNELLKEQKKRDMEFWTSISDTTDFLLMNKFQLGYPEVSLMKTLDNLIEAEREIANIEL